MHRNDPADGATGNVIKQARNHSEWDRHPKRMRHRPCERSARCAHRRADGPRPRHDIVACCCCSGGGGGETIARETEATERRTRARGACAQCRQRFCRRSTEGGVSQHDDGGGCCRNRPTDIGSTEAGVAHMQAALERTTAAWAWGNVSTPAPKASRPTIESIIAY